MVSKKFNEVTINRIDKCLDTMLHKADEYATHDRLHNFKVAAVIQDCTPITALGGMMCKHTVSVYDLIKDHEQGKHIPLELWDEKIGDSINYLLLLNALIIEEAEKKEGKKK